MSIWRRLDWEEEQNAASQMAMDELLLRSVASGVSPPTFRFLSFTPCVLVGRHQVVAEEVDEKACRRLGYPIGRRLTGGGALFLDRDCLGWEFVAPLGTGGLPWGKEELKEALCTAVALGLSRLGAKVIFRPRNDLEVGGRKVGGTGGIYSSGTFLYQGTVLISFDPQLMTALLRLPLPKLQKHAAETIAARLTSLEREIGRKPALQEVKDAVLCGIEKELGITVVFAPPTERERELLDSLLPFFRSRDWVYGERRKGRFEGRAKKVFPGGVLSCGVLLSGRRAQLEVREVFFTGDFFFQPPESLPRLEAALKGCPVEDIESRVGGFFEASGAECEGLEPADFAGVLLEAVRAALRGEVAP